ncbi:MAG: GIY-YIG nuclease family protein [Candidatus Diapherotrites archaeon]|nr:GIY-YIG nuclease family protein [Candidatus Diapherotrites archaeon]
MVFFVYLVECADGSFYCGYTSDIIERIKVHNKGHGGSYTRAHLPVKLVYFEKRKSRKSAMRRELEIKSLGRNAKELLIKNSEIDKK